MSYTLTMDASHKVKKSGSHARGFFRHICREADEEKGVYYNHRNRNIDASRTHLNETYVNDGNGSFEAGGSAEMEAYYHQRLSEVTGRVQGNSVAMRPLILQPDPKWIEEKCPNWRTEGLTGEGEEVFEHMIEWATEKFGQENIVGVSLHMDEYHPQLHVAMTPITDDGRLSQKDFFGSPKQLTQMHQDFRDRMISQGYDAEKKVSSRSTQHLSSEEFGALSDERREAAEEAAKLREAAEADRDDAAAKLRAAKHARAAGKKEGYADGYEQGKAAVADDSRAAEADRAAAAQARRIAEQQQEEAAEAAKWAKHDAQQQIQALAELQTLVGELGAMKSAAKERSKSAYQAARKKLSRHSVNQGPSQAPKGPQYGE